MRAEPDVVSGRPNWKTQFMSQIWELVHAERKALIKDLAELSEEQWATPSLCAGWTVQDVAAHLIDNARTTTPRLAIAMAKARFDFDQQNANGVAAEKGASAQETLAALREVAERRSGPPAPLASRLVEEIAHGEDIRRPLGIERNYPPQSVQLAISYQTRTSKAFGGAKELARRVTLVAEDDNFNLGTGMEIRGPLIELLMLVTGREERRGSIHGPGVAFI